MGAEIFNLKLKDSDITVIYEQNNSLPIVSLQLIFGVAGSVEDGANNGLASFTSAVLNDGNKALGAVGFAQVLEQNAISISAQTGTETLSFELSSLSERFGKGVEMLGSLLATPNFSKQSYVKIKTLIKAGISRKQSDFDSVATKELRKILYTDKNFGASATLESIEAISLKDIENFYSSHVDISNLTVVAGGDISKEQLIEAIKSATKSLKVGAKRELKRYEVSTAGTHSTIQKPTEQAYIYFGAPYNLAYNDENLHLSRLAGFILGESGFGSRLMEEIRVKRGLAYSAYGRVILSKTASRFTGHLQTKNENKDEAIKLVKEVVADFVKSGVTQSELDQAKRFLLGSEPLRVETLSQRLSRAYNDHYRGFEQGHTLKSLEKIEKTSLNELNEFIKKHTEINALSFAVVTE